MRSAAEYLFRALALSAPLVSAAPSALADITKDECVEANGKGQDFRRDGKLSAAREQFAHCASLSCPTIVRDDCTKRLDEVESVQPTVVFDVKDPTGRDVSAVKVVVDGAPLVNRLDGTALRIDPGEHVFVFTAGDKPPTTATFVLKEGDKDRRERIVVGQAAISAASPPPAPTPAAPPTPPPGQGSTGGLGTQQLTGLVSAGAGAVGIAVGSVFGAMTLSAASQQKQDCASSACTSDAFAKATLDHSTGETDRTVSYIGLIGGGVLLVGGAVLFFTAGRAHELSSTTGVVVLPSLAPGGGAVLALGAF
jgi:hypothetical protein